MVHMLFVLFFLIALVPSAAAQGKSFPVCQSRENLEQALSGAGQQANCREATITRLNSEVMSNELCRISFQTGSLVGVFADIPTEWWTTCKNLMPPQ